MLKLKDNIYWLTIKKTVQGFLDDNPFRHSAAIAYYTVFSLPGIAIITVNIASALYAKDTVKEELLTQVRLLMGQASAEQLNAVMQQTSFDQQSFFMQAISFGSLIISATTVFISLQDSLNAIWNIKPVPKKAVIGFLIKRVTSLAMVASLGFLVMVSLMADTLVGILGHALNSYLSTYSQYIITSLNIIISVGVFTLIFAVIYKVLPDAKIVWKDVKLGAVVTMILFVTGKFLIGFYLSSSSLNDSYGAAGSLVILLAWVYYSVLIVLFGAKFTFIYNQQRGRTIRPDDGAVAIEIKEIEREHKAVTEI